MADTGTRLPVRTEAWPQARVAPWRPYETLRREVDRLFEDFDRGFWHLPFGRSAFDIEPFWRRESGWGALPAADIVETGEGYEIAIELPGMDEKSIEVKLADGTLSIRGEKQAEKEEKSADFCLRERNFGSFERSFAVPDGVDAAAIDARFARGVLTVRLPKKPEARKPERRIEAKAA